MLTRAAISAAFPLAQMLTTKGIVLSPVNDTPLQMLVNASMPQAQLLTEHSAELDTAVAGFETLLEQASQAKLPDGSAPHDVCKADFIQAAKVAVAGGLNIAQNVVNPMIKKVVDEVQNFVDSDAQLASNPMNIVPIFYKEIWNSPVLETLAGRHENQFNDDLALRPLNVPQPADWTAYLSVGVPSIDAEISQFVSECSVEFLETIWKETFGPRAGQLSTVLNAPIGQAGGAYARADAAIIVFLAARRLGIDVPDGLNIDLAALRTYTTELSARGGQAIISALKRRQRDIERGIVVVARPNGPAGDVYVLADTYNVFLSNGGSPEAVFGSVLLNNQAGVRAQPSAEELLPLVQEWKRASAVIQHRITYRRQEVIVLGLQEAVARAIVNMPDDQLVAAREVHHKRLIAAIQKLSSVGQDSLWQTARTLVCNTLFAHTDVERILIAIDQAAAQYPDMDIREAALLGTTDYVVEWLCEQVATLTIQLS